MECRITVNVTGRPFINKQTSITYSPAPDILFTEVNDEMVLYDHTRGLQDGVYILDDIGARIWQLLMDYGDQAHVIEQLLLEYDVDEMTAKSELEIFINQLIEQRFLIADKTRDDE